MEWLSGFRGVFLVSLAAALAGCGASSVSDEASITGLHFTTSSEFPENPPPTNVDVTLTDPIPARAIYKATLALPAFDIPGVHGCPADRGYGHTIAFMSGQAVPVTATLNAGGCRDAEISGAPPTRMTNDAYWTLLAQNLGVEESTLFSVDSSQGNGVDLLLGTWTYSGQVPAIVNVTLTFNVDQSFSYLETVAPASTPAGDSASACITTDTYAGTYLEATSSGPDVLTLTFVGGTANQVSGCSEASLDSAGTPMTADSISSYRMQGLIPPETVNYHVDPSELVLTTVDDGTVGIGRGLGTVFSRSQ